MSDPDVANLISVAQAIDIIDSVSIIPRRGRVPLTEAAGMILAQDVIADRDYPPFEKALMDGFAVRSVDARSGQFTLKSIGEIPAGSRFDRTVRAGECVAIYTGAPMPAGADAVVPVEFVESRSGDAVTMKSSVRAGQNIARRGSDCRQGQVVLRPGSRLSAAAIAVASSVGAGEVEAFLPPRVAVLSSGDELISVDQSPEPEQIRNSNSAMLTALINRLNYVCIDRGWVKDDPGLVRQSIETALAEANVLVISGGVSMGEYDFVPRVLSDMGVEFKITKLKMKPGKPFVFGVRPLLSLQHSIGFTPLGASTPAPAAHQFIFGLPGNPVSAFVCTIRLVSRLLARLAGGTGWDAEQWITGELIEELPPNGPREFYQPAILQSDGKIKPLVWRGSADIYTLASANALLVRPENEPGKPVGTPVHVLQIPG